MSNPKIEVYAGLLDVCVSETVKVAAGVREQDRLFQLKAGKGHPMWLLGHLTNTLNVVVLQWTLGKESLLPKPYGKVFAPDFAQGAPITPNAADYPQWDEVVKFYAEVGAVAVAGLRTLNDSDLPNALKGSIPDSFRSFFNSNETVLTRMVGHDNYHRGQIAMLSKLNPA